MTEHAIDYQSRSTAPSPAHIAAAQSARGIGGFCVILGLIDVAVFLIVRDGRPRDIGSFLLLLFLALGFLCNFIGGILYLIGSVRIQFHDAFWQRMITILCATNICASFLLIAVFFPFSHATAILIALGVFAPAAWWQIKLIGRLRALRANSL